MSTNSLKANEVVCVRQDKFLFQPVTFQLNAGEGLWIEGPNGVGKSSLLRMLAGFATCGHGQLLWNDDSSAVTEMIHYLGHADGVRAGLTVLENLRLAGELCGFTEDALRANPSYDFVLEMMRLGEQAHTEIKYLSAGQKRRAALCKVFAIPRALWILDEPLTALDYQTQQIVIEKIKEHLAKGGICVMTSHQPLLTSLPQMQRLELMSC